MAMSELQQAYWRRERNRRLGWRWRKRAQRTTDAEVRERHNRGANAAMRAYRTECRNVAALGGTS